MDLTWGDPEQPIPSSSVKVKEDNMDNYSETEMQTTLKVSYTQTTSDTTIREHAWGFELSASAEFGVDVPFVGGESVSTTASASYNGKYGTENPVQDTSTVENSRTVACPPRTQTQTVFCATDLNSGETDCPHFDWMV